jgi:hypothetical protein
VNHPVFVIAIGTFIGFTPNEGIVR